MASPATDHPPAVELLRAEGEKLVVRAREFKNRDFVDLRLHVRLDSGEWVPTRRGVTLRSQEELDKVAAALQELRPTLPS